MSKKKRKKFRDFESKLRYEEFQDPYICMTYSMLDDEKWLSLGYPAQIIYIHMKKWSYGRQEFKFSYRLGLHVFKSYTTFKRAIDELVDKGFIEIVRISRTPGIGTIYKFSNKWYN